MKCPHPPESPFIRGTAPVSFDLIVSISENQKAQKPGFGNHSLYGI
jgi:hypothetical protein